MPRTAEQRAELARAGGFLVPERAIDSQSLIAYADLVVSAGGTMNREAVALGTPVWTTFEGRLGAVDERLIAEGRMRKLTSPAELVLAKRDGAGEVAARVRRDPRLLVDLLTSPLG
jgi:predicted glycosyltransferase